MLLLHMLVALTIIVPDTAASPSSGQKISHLKVRDRPIRSPWLFLAVEKFRVGLLRKMSRPTLNL